METAQDAPLNLMGVVNICGCVLWVWPWYLMAIRKSWSLCLLLATMSREKEKGVARETITMLHADWKMVQYSEIIRFSVVVNNYYVQCSKLRQLGIFAFFVCLE